MKYVHITPEFKLSVVTVDVYNCAAALRVTVHDWRQKCVNKMFTIYQVPLVTVVLTFFSAHWKRHRFWYKYAVLCKGRLFTKEMQSGIESSIPVSVNGIMLSSVLSSDSVGRALFRGQSYYPACPHLWFAFTGIRPRRHLESDEWWMSFGVAALSTVPNSWLSCLQLLFL